MTKDFKEEIQQLEIPKEITTRVQIGIQKAIQERSKKRKKRYLPIMVASVALITVVSFANLNEGFASIVTGYFKDITTWNGTVVGTEYAEATKDILFSATEPIDRAKDIIIPVSVEISDSTKPPFGIIELLSIGTLELINSKGDTIDTSLIQISSDQEAPNDFSISIENKTKLLGETTSKGDQTRIFKANIIVPKDQITEGTLSVKITSFYGLSKADAPLAITGDWQVNIN